MRKQVSGAVDEPLKGQRIDKWLYFARVVKTRTLATRLAQGGKVRVNRQKIDNAARRVRPGDVLTITLRGRVRVLKVLAAGARRGSPADAALLFEDLSPSPAIMDAAKQGRAGSGGSPPRA